MGLGQAKDALIQIRLYDPRGQRRPVAEVDWGEAPFQALDAQGSSIVAAGNATGGLALFDVRGRGGKGCLLHVFKGAAGGIRGVALHPAAPLVASVAADRFFRLHERDSRRLLASVYCKTPLSALLLRTTGPLSILDKAGDLRLPDQPSQPLDPVKKVSQF